MNSGEGIGDAPQWGLSYEEWLDYIFNGSLSGRADWAIRLELDAGHQCIMEYLTRFFESAETLAKTRDNGQLADACHRIRSSEPLSFGKAVYDRRVSEASFSSMFAVMPRFFQVIVARSSSTASSATGKPLSLIDQPACVFWDSSFIRGIAKSDSSCYRPGVAEPLLACLEQIVNLPSESVQFGALHGLGQMHACGHAPRVKKIIDAFLASHPHASNRIKEWARKARGGTPDYL